jgi:H/ACA ribonucleoprotein complex subunit 2
MAKSDKKEKKAKVAEADVSIAVEDVDEEDVEMRDEGSKVCNNHNFYRWRELIGSVTWKDKKSKDEPTVSLEDLSPIAQPLAQKKLLKKIHKTIKKGAWCRAFHNSL